MVNITKSASPPLENEPNDRFVKYQMQSVARHILTDFRVRICLRHQVEKYGGVDVFKHRSTLRAFYGGLMVCGSVWVCPVCASKISERRRSEVAQAMAKHKESRGQLSMLTLTFSHHKSDKLNDLILAFSKALRKMQSGKRYAKLRDKLGYVGTIRAFEITYGSNGWHPHVHILIFHRYPIDPYDWTSIEDTYYDLWQGACAANGLSCNRQNGVKLEDAKQAENYIAKHGEEKMRTWTTDMELTKANSKKGRIGSLTPFDFLRIVIEDGDLEYSEKFKEYAVCTKGMRQLFWSRGLKDYFHLEDKTDEELAVEKQEEADLLGNLEWRDWKYILDNGLRATLLDYIEQHGYDVALSKIGLKKEKTLQGTVSNP